MRLQPPSYKLTLPPGFSQGSSPSRASAWRPPFLSTPRARHGTARRGGTHAGSGAAAGRLAAPLRGGRRARLPPHRPLTLPPPPRPPSPALTERCCLAAVFGALLIVVLPRRLDPLGGQQRQRGLRSRLRSLLRCHLLQGQPGSGRKQESRGRGTCRPTHTPLIWERGGAEGKVGGEAQRRRPGTYGGGRRRARTAYTSQSASGLRLPGAWALPSAPRGGEGRGLGHARR